MSLFLSAVYSYGGDYIIPPWVLWIPIVIFFVFKIFVAVLREQRTIFNYVCLILLCICFAQLINTMMPTVISFVPHYKLANWRFIPFFSLINYFRYYGYSIQYAIIEFAKITVFAFAVGALQRCVFKRKVINILLPTLPYLLLQLIKLLFDYTYQFDFGRIIVMLTGFFLGYLLINAFWIKLSPFFYKQISQFKEF